MYSGDRFSPEIKERAERVTSRIELHFVRHGEKENDKTKPDEMIELTETGRGQARSKAHDDDITQSVSFGSPRVRTQQTAGLMMSGGLDGITGDESLEELRAKLNKDLAIGSKMAVEKRLNFNLDLSKEYVKKAMEASERNEWLKFLVEQSDDLVTSLDDAESDSYSRIAGRIAEIVKKYLDIAPRFDKLAQDEKKNVEDTLKRFLGTHQGIGESFLAKVIEKTKGISMRDAFVSALGNQGFGYAEGFDVQVETVDGKKQTVRISFKKEKDGQTLFEFNELVPKELIEEMILQK